MTFLRFWLAGVSSGWAARAIYLHHVGKHTDESILFGVSIFAALLFIWTLKK